MRTILPTSIALALAACSSPRRGEVDTTADAPSDITADAQDADVAADIQPPDTLPAGDTSAVSKLVLDPATLVFFSLPIGSYRVAVSGLDPDAGMCATIVFDYSNTDHDFEAHCDRFGDHFPYVLVAANGPDGAGANESCIGLWDYQSDLETLGTTGCFDAGELPPPGLDLADFEVEVRGAAFSGTIAVDNRATFAPAPVSLGFTYTTDIPEDVWIQTGDAYGLPGWVQVLKDEAPLLIHDRCDVPACDDPDGGVCGIAFQTVRSLTHGTHGGSAWLTWDGAVRVPSADGSCRDTEPAAPGDYVARFCFGWQVTEDAGGQVVSTPTCVDTPFTYPTPVVIGHADFGG